RQGLPDDRRPEVGRRRAGLPEGPDQALLRAVQGARKGQVGEGRGLGGRRRGVEGNQRRRRELQEVSRVFAKRKIDFTLRECLTDVERQAGLVCLSSPAPPIERSASCVPPTAPTRTWSSCVCRMVLLVRVAL